jgi:hypothetical protein
MTALQLPQLDRIALRASDWHMTFSRVSIRRNPPRLVFGGQFGC